MNGEVDVEVTWGSLQVISLPSPAISNQLIAGKARLVGWSLRETTGAAAASVNFTSGGNVIATSAMPSGTSDNHYPPGGGIIASSDISITVLAGSFTGAVYVRALA